tara:strand:+ start:1493 stop:1633 length:141 start_codon:yes stop_codon:yes gene_type:complete
MDKLALQVRQRIAYKVTTMRSYSLADNIVDQICADDVRISERVKAG